jgi:hypothetical protein
MAQVQYTTMLDYILPQCPGLTILYASTLLRRAAREFCRNTHCIRLWTADIPLVVNQPEYSVALANYSPVRLFQVGLNGQPKQVLRAGEIDAQERAQAGAVFGAYMSTPTTVRVFKTPNSLSTLQLDLSWMPDATSQTCDDWLISTHAEHIATGARGYAMSEKDRPWSNAQHSLMELSDFQKYIGRYAVLAAKSHGTEHGRVMRTL